MKAPIRGYFSLLITNGILITHRSNFTHSHIFFNLNACINNSDKSIPKKFNPISPKDTNFC
ncbi:TPA: hypothetical protein DIC21_01005 [Candidatus Uhrbacteria bacterium]|nr:hypothetical protein [Candidatus Uhrbacteria bacterium]